MSQNKLKLIMHLSKVESDNAGASAEDFVKDRYQLLIETNMAEFAPIVVDFTARVSSGEFENTPESFRKYLRLTPCPDPEVKPKGRLPAGSTAGTTRKATKELTADQIAMYTAISEDKWDWNWFKDKCQRFQATGKGCNRFCGDRVPEGSPHCPTCGTKATCIKEAVLFRDGKMTPELWFEKKTEMRKKQANELLGRKDGETVSRLPKKTVSREPPPSRTTTRPSLSTDVKVMRSYIGRDKPTDQKLYWIHSNKGNYVFDAGKKLYGTAKLNNSSIIPATDDDVENFAIFSETLNIPVSAPVATARPRLGGTVTDVKASPLTRPPPKAAKPVEEESLSIEEDDDEDEDEYD